VAGGFSEKQTAELGKWFIFSVLFSLTGYALAAVTIGLDARTLFGDGSLVLIGVGLTVAAGATAFGDGTAELKRPWMWFGILAGVLVLGAGTYAAARNELHYATRDARDATPLTFEEALMRNAAENDATLSSSEEFGILRSRLSNVLDDLNLAENSSDRETVVARQQDVIDELVADMDQAEASVSAEHTDQIGKAERRAVASGVIVVVGGLALGFSAVLRVNRSVAPA
jgi:hypothetical protein